MSHGPECETGRWGSRSEVLVEMADEIKPCYIGGVHGAEALHDGSGATVVLTDITGTIFYPVQITYAALERLLVMLEWVANVAVDRQAARGVAFPGFDKCLMVPELESFRAFAAGPSGVLHMRVSLGVGHPPITIAGVADRHRLADAARQILGVCEELKQRETGPN